MGELIKLRLTFESVMVNEPNDIEFQYLEIGLNESGIGQDNIEILLLNIGQEQVIQYIELFLFFQGIRKELDQVKHEYG